MSKVSPVSCLLLSACLLVCCAVVACDGKNARDDKLITVRGVLTRVAAIGGETTGWAIRLDKPLELEGKTYEMLEVSADANKLTPHEEKRVEATGRVVWRQGVERGRWPLLEIASLKEIKSL